MRLLRIALVALAQSGPVNRGDVNASRWPGDQGEVSIALDRSDPRRALAATMNLNEGGLLTMASGDGGESWYRSLLPLPEGAAWHADPMVAFDSRGTAYLAVIPVTRDNSSLGIEVHRSEDIGRTWSPPIRLSKATGRDDKLALAVDDGPRSPFRDRIHVVWKWPGGGIYYSFSDDGGRRFSRPRLIEVEAVSGLDLAVTDEGELYVAASDGAKRVMRVLRSPDGGASFLPSVAVAPVRAQWYTSQPSHCRRQSLVHASIAVSKGGRVAVTWSDFAAPASGSCGDLCRPETVCSTEVFLSRSSDGGRTWSAPSTLPDALPGTDRYFQWSRADRATGALYLAYKDSRLDPRRIATDVFLSCSPDFGLTWDAPLRLSSASSDASGSSFQYGDYQGLAVVDGEVYAAWSDYRDPDDGEIYVGRARFGTR